MSCWREADTVPVAVAFRWFVLKLTRLQQMRVGGLGRPHACRFNHPPAIIRPTTWGMIMLAWRLGIPGSMAARNLAGRRHPPSTLSLVSRAAGNTGTRTGATLRHLELTVSGLGGRGGGAWVLPPEAGKSNAVLVMRGREVAQASSLRRLCLFVVVML